MGLNGPFAEGKKYHQTFPVPEQFGHLLVVDNCKESLQLSGIEFGPMLENNPLAEHRAQAKYPVHQESSSFTNHATISKKKHEAMLGVQDA